MQRILAIVLISIFHSYCYTSEEIITYLPPERWAEYRELRLTMLLETPNAFGATYEEESLYPNQQWYNYLVEATQEKRTVLKFCLKNNAIIGMGGAKIGQTPKTQHKATLFSIYLLPQYRGSGIAKRLVQAILDTLKEKETIKKIDLVVSADQQNARNLYKKLGFSTEGFFKNFWFFNGTSTDVYSMSMFL